MESSDEHHRLKLEIAELKRELARHKRHAENWREIAEKRKLVIRQIRQELKQIITVWLKFFESFRQGDWRKRSEIIKYWFIFCEKRLPRSEDELEKDLAENLPDDHKP